VVSPSDPVRPDTAQQFDAGVETLRRFGFEVVQGKYTHSRSWGYAASPQEKAEDINRMFADPAIDAVICTQGGTTANAPLPYLDWEWIRANPKIFLGISDITVLLNAIHAKTGLVTFHGNDVMWGFGIEHTDYDVEEFFGRLVEGQIGPVRPNGPRRTVRGGSGEGILLGGNLNCLQKLFGTPYMPDFSGAILCLEALNIRPEVCDMLFQQCKQVGLLESLQGAVVGYIDGVDNNPEAEFSMEDILEQVTDGMDFPILKVNDFGHNCPNTVLPIGCRARLDADSQVLEIVEPCVV
jgi:muramoyltetrapeptide carboxypeptidase